MPTDQASDKPIRSQRTPDCVTSVTNQGILKPNADGQVSRIEAEAEASVVEAISEEDSGETPIPPHLKNPPHHDCFLDISKHDVKNDLLGELGRWWENRPVVASRPRPRHQYHFGT